jgi:hypothetical protein
MEKQTRENQETHRYSNHVPVASQVLTSDEFPPTAEAENAGLILTYKVAAEEAYTYWFQDISYRLKRGNFWVACTNTNLKTRPAREAKVTALSARSVRTLSLRFHFQSSWRLQLGLLY